MEYRDRDSDNETQAQTLLDFHITKLGRSVEHTSGSGTHRIVKAQPTLSAGCRNGRLPNRQQLFCGQPFPMVFFHALLCRALSHAL